ncbi:excalibur calcium-binding domain-containing protein [Pseudarthrobacter enclensis]|uniref:Chemotaxis protein histidine kinase CheA n=1 Tax=Pseudarthrobacter enclensis TaxID=993070 RepID=A0ABT9S187_9MICC|nr:excalibur calcium-binding domain-containing protein [Pseudarthrobacter enclensis]MDP9890831.1 chemotaxis protein histidine kinase CheA [Pseudarthrobacter enclensis]
MKEQFSTAAGRLKKTLALAVLAGLMLTGCGGKQAATQPTATATATSVSATTDMVTVPGVLNLTLDKATDQLEKLGFKVEAADTAHGKSIDIKKNWQVMSQDPASGAQAPKGSPVRLGVKSLDDLAAEKAAADKAAADKAASEKAAAAKAAADKAAADKAAADQAAAAKAATDQAAADQAAAAQQAAQAPAPAPVSVPAAPAAAYYANCTAAKAAGAAPLYRGQPGYRSALDRDGDGVACER